MILNINTKIFIFVILVLTSLAQQVKENFQKRELYYNSDDYVCHTGMPRRKDLVRLVLEFRVQKNVTFKYYYSDGGTICNNMVTQPWHEVNAVKNWNYLSRNEDYTNKTLIRFNQTITTKYTRFLKRTKSIVVSAKIYNPTIIEDVPYDCQVQGNGAILHYGIYERNEEPCTFFIKCKERKGVVQQ